jgi:hypothetical protein
MEAGSLIKALNEFVVLQNMNAMIANAMSADDPKTFGLREKVIYVIFFESAALLILRNAMSAKEIETYMQQTLFNPNGICDTISDITITDKDRQLAESLLVLEDPTSTKISVASAEALGAFVSGNGDSTNRTLARLIADKTIFPSLGKNSSGAFHVKDLIQGGQPDDHPIYSIDFEQRIAPGTAMQIAHYLPGLSYGMGAIALIQGAESLKGWIIGLIIGTWCSRRAISMALQGRATGDLDDSSVSFAIAVHWICLLGLLACSIVVFSR